MIQRIDHGPRNQLIQAAEAMEKHQLQQDLDVSDDELGVIWAKHAAIVDGLFGVVINKMSMTQSALPRYAANLHQPLADLLAIEEDQAATPDRETPIHS